MGRTLPLGEEKPHRSDQVLGLLVAVDCGPPLTNASSLDASLLPTLLGPPSKLKPSGRQSSCSHFPGFCSIPVSVACLVLRLTPCDGAAAPHRGVSHAAASLQGRLVPSSCQGWRRPSAGLRPIPVWLVFHRGGAQGSAAQRPQRERVLCAVTTKPTSIDPSTLWSLARGPAGRSTVEGDSTRPILRLARCVHAQHNLCSLRGAEWAINTNRGTLANATAPAGKGVWAWQRR